MNCLFKGTKVLSYLIWYFVHIPICTKTSFMYLYLVDTYKHTHIYSVFCLSIYFFIAIMFICYYVRKFNFYAKCYQKEFSHKFTYFLYRCVMPYVRIPEQEERRLPRQCNSQKGKFIADSSQGSCHIQRSGAGSESPEPKLLHKFIGWV